MGTNSTMHQERIQQQQQQLHPLTALVPVPVLTSCSNSQHIKQFSPQYIPTSTPIPIKGPNRGIPLIQLSFLTMLVTLLLIPLGIRANVTINIPTNEISLSASSHTDHLTIPQVTTTTTTTITTRTTTATLDVEKLSTLRATKKTLPQSTSSLIKSVYTISGLDLDQLTQKQFQHQEQQHNEGNNDDKDGANLTLNPSPQSNDPSPDVEYDTELQVMPIPKALARISETSQLSLKIQVKPTAQNSILFQTSRGHSNDATSTSTSKTSPHPPYPLTADDPNPYITPPFFTKLTRMHYTTPQDPLVPDPPPPVEFTLVAYRVYQCWDQSAFAMRSSHGTIISQATVSEWDTDKDFSTPISSCFYVVFDLRTSRNNNNLRGGQLELHLEGQTQQRILTFDIPFKLSSGVITSETFPSATLLQIPLGQSFHTRHGNNQIFFQQQYRKGRFHYFIEDVSPPPESNGAYTALHLKLDFAIHHPYTIFHNPEPFDRIFNLEWTSKLDRYGMYSRLQDEKELLEVARRRQPSCLLNSQYLIPLDLESFTSQSFSIDIDILEFFPDFVNSKAESKDPMSMSLVCYNFYVATTVIYAPTFPLINPPYCTEVSYQYYIPDNNNNNNNNNNKDQIETEIDTISNDTPTIATSTTATKTKTTPITALSTATFPITIITSLITAQRLFALSLPDQLTCSTCGANANVRFTRCVMKGHHINSPFAFTLGLMTRFRESSSNSFNLGASTPNQTLKIHQLKPIISQAEDYYDIFFTPGLDNMYPQQDDSDNDNAYNDKNGDVDDVDNPLPTPSITSPSKPQTPILSRQHRLHEHSDEVERNLSALRWLVKKRNGSSSLSTPKTPTTWLSQGIMKVMMMMMGVSNNSNNPINPLNWQLGLTSSESHDDYTSHFAFTQTILNSFFQADVDFFSNSAYFTHAERIHLPPYTIFDPFSTFLFPDQPINESQPTMGPISRPELRLIHRFHPQTPVILDFLSGIRETSRIPILAWNCTVGLPSTSGSISPSDPQDTLPVSDYGLDFIPIIPTHSSSPVLSGSPQYERMIDHVTFSMSDRSIGLSTSSWSHKQRMLIFFPQRELLFKVNINDWYLNDQARKSSAIPDNILTNEEKKRQWRCLINEDVQIFAINYYVFENELQHDIASLTLIPPPSKQSQSPEYGDFLDIYVDAVEFILPEDSSVTLSCLNTDFVLHPTQNNPYHQHMIGLAALARGTDQQSPKPDDNKVKSGSTNLSSKPEDDNAFSFSDSTMIDVVMNVIIGDNEIDYVPVSVSIAPLTEPPHDHNILIFAISGAIFFIITVSGVVFTLHRSRPKSINHQALGENINAQDNDHDNNDDQSLNNIPLDVFMDQDISSDTDEIQDGSSEDDDDEKRFDLFSHQKSHKIRYKIRNRQRKVMKENQTKAQSALHEEQQQSQEDDGYDDQNNAVNTQQQHPPPHNLVKKSLRDLVKQEQSRTQDLVTTGINSGDLPFKLFRSKKLTYFESQEQLHKQYGAVNTTTVWSQSLQIPQLCETNDTNTISTPPGQSPQRQTLY